MRFIDNCGPKCPCKELRRALDLTQQQVAASLGINQVAISKMEGQTDMYAEHFAPLRQTMGGELHRGPFPEGNVEISQFKREPEPEPTEPAAV